MMHISFKDLELLLEVNNPELYELDEADQLAYYVIKELTGKTKENWQIVDKSVYPDPKEIYYMTFQNKAVSDWMKKNPGKDIQGSPVYYYTKFQLDRNLMNQLRMDKIISLDMSDTTFYFFQALGGDQYIKDMPIRNFGLSGYDGNHIAIVFTKFHTLQQIKTEIIQTIVHELNHDYDRGEFHKNDSLVFNQPGTAQGQEYFGVKNIPLSPDFKKKLVEIGKWIQFLTRKNLLSKHTKEGVVWITRAWELKSMTKEFVKYCEYNSIPWESSSTVSKFIDHYNEDTLNALDKWLESILIERVGILKDIEATQVYSDEEALVKFAKTLFSYVKDNILYILSVINQRKKINFR